MRRHLLAPAAALLLFTPAFVGTPAPRAEDTELEVHMKAINTATRKLRTALKDPARAAECMTIVLEMQTHALAAKALEPKMLAGIADAAEQGKSRVEYRKEMHGLLGRMFALELAVLEGRGSDAETELKDLLKSKGPAHEKFQIEEEHK